MLPNDLKQIEEKDLVNLVSNQVSENRSLEYKLTLPGYLDEDKKEFLADVSSFANTVGGDILYGVESSGGIATEVKGLSTPDYDAEVLRLESIISSGLQPRITHQIQVVNIASGNKVIVIRIRQSFLAPHRIIFKSHDRFYGRNSAGKYALDVEQLRSAFLQSDTIIEKIKDFHSSRILEIQADRVPFPLIGESKLVLHFLPLEAFSSNISISQKQVLSVREKEINLTKPMVTRNWNFPVPNLDGWVIDAGTPFEDKTVTRSYIQIFRKGMIESVESGLLDTGGDGWIPSYSLEKEIIGHSKQCLKLLNQLGFSIPVYIFITLTNVEGMKLTYGNSTRWEREVVPVKQNIINLPEVTITNYEDDVARSLHSSLNILWNACGVAESPNFDEEGNWIVR